MNIKLLTYVITVADQQSFRAAAETLHISQPPLSQQIKQLEQNLGQTLFDRQPRKVVLTPFGRDFVRRARPLVAQHHDFQQEITLIAAGQLSRLAIGCTGALLEIGIAQAIGEYRQEHPQLPLSLHESGSLELVQRVVDGTLDIAFVRQVDHSAEQCQMHPIYTDHYCLAIPSFYPLAQQSHCDLQALESIPMIWFPRNSFPALYDQLISCFQQAGVSPTISQEVSTKSSTLALVQAGFGAALVPAKMIDTARPGVSFLTIEATLPKVQISAATRLNSQAPQISSFIDQIRQRLNRES